MKTAHTPGPWELGHKDNQTIYSGGKRVAVAMCSEKGWAANSRLIAAAPSLRDALEPFAKYYNEHHKNLSDDTVAFGLETLEITVGQLRRASKALARLNGDSHE